MSEVELSEISTAESSPQVEVAVADVNAPAHAKENDTNEQEESDDEDEEKDDDMSMSVTPKPDAVVSRSSSKANLTEDAVKVEIADEKIPVGKDTSDADMIVTKKSKSDGGDDKKVPFFKLFRYAKAFDFFLYFCGIIMSIGHGIFLPLLALVLGDLIDTLGPNVGGDDEAQQQIFTVATQMGYYGCGLFGVTALQNFFLKWTETRQLMAMRKAYLDALLRKDVGWYDRQGKPGALTIRFNSDLPRISEGLGPKIGTYAQVVSQAVTGLVIGFVTNYSVALILLATSPVLLVSVGLFGKIIAGIEEATNKIYAVAASAADETLGLVRTVTAFGTEKKEHGIYEKELTAMTQGIIKYWIKSGLTFGCFQASIWIMFGLTFYYGGYYIGEWGGSAGDILNVLLALLTGLFGVILLAPAVEAVAKAQGAAHAVWAEIDAATTVDSLSDKGKRPESVEGTITFKQVNFSYPTAPELAILKGLDVEMKQGQTVALVGESGCGKSTTIQLLERFYSLDMEGGAGQILLDGVPLDELNVEWYRDQVSLVAQMPTLFPLSIFDNIALGAKSDQKVTMEEVIAAAKIANAHEFISQFPDGYQTLCGDQGAQLSGGQKQRIAIARAVIKNPKILLLDEATSALDNESEVIVQKALNNASKGRTTIVIAHRLTTIEDADLICVYNSGVVSERGTYTELVELGGEFAGMVNAQKLAEVEIEGLDENATTGTAKQYIKNRAEELDNTSGVSSKTTEEKEDHDGDKKKSDKKKNKKKKKNSVEDGEEEEDEDEEPVDANMTLFGMKQSKKEWYLICIAIFVAFAEGAILGSFGLIFSETIQTLFFLNTDVFDNDYWNDFFLEATVDGIKANPLAGQPDLSYKPEDWDYTNELTIKSTLCRFPSQQCPLLLEGNELVDQVSESAGSGFFDVTQLGDALCPVDQGGKGTRVWPFDETQCDATVDTTYLDSLEYEDMVDQFNNYATNSFFDFAREDFQTNGRGFTPEDDMLLWLGVYMALAVALFITSFIRFVIIGISSGRVVARIRSRLYWVYLNMDPEWHDDPKNLKSKVTSVLKGDADRFSGAFINNINAYCVAFGAITAGLVISLTRSVLITLFVLALVPVIVVSQVIQVQFLQDQNSDLYKKSAAQASLAVSNVKTVYALNRARYFKETYNDLLSAPSRSNIAKGLGAGLALGFSEAFSQFFLFACTFAFGGYVFVNDPLRYYDFDSEQWVPYKDITVQDVFTGVFGLIFGALQAGNAFALVGDAEKGRKSAEVVYRVLTKYEALQAQPDDTTYKGRIQMLQKNLEDKPENASQPLKAIVNEVSSSNPDREWNTDDVIGHLEEVRIKETSDLNNDELVDETKRIKGQIEFKDVRFTYPQRPNIEVLKGISFSVEVGQTVALVGGSGSGKSTIVSLLERFYEPTHGQILIDGIPTTEMNKKVQRSCIGLVAQEPRLFDRTIRENIVYGIDGEGEIEIPEQQVIQAAKDANAWDFIQRTQSGLETKVGLKGEGLSGGQRQRVAIARAIVKGSDVKILLLDEATSALDSVNEKIVQAALDKASEGRTTVVVAHRLSTIQNADKIIVMDRGEIVEEGTHQELLRLHGYYHQLVNRTEG